MGRHSKFNATRAKAILTAAQSGEYLETCAAYAGVDPTTLRDWLRRGEREPRTPLGRFRAQYLRACAKWRVAAMTRIAKAGQSNWQADAWRLERRFPAEYGRRVPKADDTSAAQARGAIRALIDDLRARHGQGAGGSDPEADS